MTAQEKPELHPFTTYGGADCEFLMSSGRRCGWGQFAKIHAGQGTVTRQEREVPWGQPIDITPEEAAQRWPGAPAQPGAPDTVELVMAEMERSIELLRIKNAAYGDAWRYQGYLGNLLRLASKVDRLKNMLWRDDPKTDPSESVESTCHDIMNIAAFMAINYSSGVRWGSENRG